jgi:hypothetical protein
MPQDGGAPMPLFFGRPFDYPACPIMKHNKIRSKGRKQVAVSSSSCHYQSLAISPAIYWGGDICMEQHTFDEINK